MSRLPVSPEEFHKLALRVSDLTTNYLRELPDLAAFPSDVTGKSALDEFGSELPEDGVGEHAFDALPGVFAAARPNAPGFFGYVFGSGEPIAALGDFAASVLNQNVTAWRSSPSAVTIERQVVSWLAESIGCKGMRGSLCGGGSSANLMALCMAREAKAPANEHGAQGGVIYTSTETHMSTPKAAAVLGLGHQAVRYIEVDSDFRMRMDLLESAIQADVAAGKKPIAVVATAGTVATGSIDRLDAIADICSKYGLWMHVDGAYGALAAMAAPEKFSGIERADSITLDPHKWLYQPVDCSCLLYKDLNSASRAFSHSGDYTKVLQTDPLESFAFFEESLELSRRFRALKLWLSVRYHGMAAFRAAIGEDLRLAHVLAQEIDASSKLERLNPVALSAVCFRYKCEDSDNANAAILKEVIRRGRVYISNATIHGKFVLRACVTNHRSMEADVKAVVKEVIASANSLGI
jgi:aromatic-L-amino-acid/L-tryptophan decarboxylase